jgi:hypothetical protein
MAIIFTPFIAFHKKLNNTKMVTFFQNIQSALLEDNDDIDVKKEEKSSNVFNVAVKKDVLNPLLTNITTRVVNIDSQYRDNKYDSKIINSSDFSSTYFNATLCDQLYNVLSITLDNVIIPKSWYTIDTAYNNNFFWITNYGKDYLIIIESGNYSGVEFVKAMESSLKKAGFKNPTNHGFCNYDSKANNFSFTLEGCFDPKENPINIFFS